MKHKTIADHKCSLKDNKESCLKHFCSTDREIHRQLPEVQCEPKKESSILPFPLPPPGPTMRSVAVQTPTLPRRCNAATPTLRRNVNGGEESVVTNSSFREFIQSLTPRLGRKRANKPSSVTATSTKTKPLDQDSFLDDSSSSFSSIVATTTDRRPNYCPNQIMIVEIGAAGLHFGKRCYREVPIKQPLPVQEEEEEEDSVDERGEISQKRRKNVRKRRKKKRYDLDRRLEGSRTKRVSFIPDDVKGLTQVRLKKQPGTTLGITITGGSDKGYRPRVSNLRLGSSASQSDTLNVGDYILSVNGESTAGLSHESVINLLRNSDEKVDLQIEYEMPEMPLNERAVFEKTVSIVLKKENGTFGFTVRGGSTSDGHSRPLLVTHVRPGGPADREGSLKAGDRLVAVDGRDLSRASLSQAHLALQDVERSTTLGIRFDVSIMDSVRYAGGPLLVEIERLSGSPLGVSLNSSKFNNYSLYSSSKVGFNQIFIESIVSASIAERCGALAIGDTVCSVNGVRLDRSNLQEANQILREGKGSKVTLEIIPNNKNYINGTVAASPILSSPSSQRFSLYNTIGANRSTSTATRRIQKRIREDCALSSCRAIGVSHPEILRATLLTEGRGVGIALRPPLDSTYPFVAALDPEGAADRCGVIKVGDRILAVNGRNVSSLGVSDVNQMMSNTRPTVIIDVEFEVADTVVPSTGIFSVKLSKRDNYLGIALAKGKQIRSDGVQGESILISDVVRGSSAHRTGTLQVGDKLLAVENTRVDGLSVDEAYILLDDEGDVVTLKVQKDDFHSDDGKCVIYTVQLLQDGGAIGISARGSEEPFDPIFIGAIAPGSLAAQTDAIHVGDRLLAINDISLRGKPLTEAVQLLQETEHTVALTISRPKERKVEANSTWMSCQPSTYTLSIDSAVESLDSGALLQTKRDSSPDIYEQNGNGRVQDKLFEDSNRINGKMLSWNSSSSDSGQSGDKMDWDKMIADLNEISATCGLRETSVLRDEDYTTSKSNGDLPESSNVWKGGAAPVNCKIKSSSEPSINSFKMIKRNCSPEIYDNGTYSLSKATAIHRANTPSSAGEHCNGGPIIALTLAKDQFYEDFGFSVSDGLYEKGVYVNKIRKGGPADKSGLLQPFDRIVQVNDTDTEDFDCCLTVPLIASADNRLFLKITRQTTFLNLNQEYGPSSWLDADRDSGLASTSFTKEYL